MGRELVPDGLWEAIEPLLPEEPAKPKGGRPRVDDRAALAGIVFVLKTGIPWEMLPQEMGCGPGSTCWRRLRDWQEAGRAGRAAPGLARPPRRGRPHRLVEGVPGLCQRARKKGGERVGKNPTDRGKPGSKRHLVSDRGGVPLAVALTAANVHDSMAFESLVDGIEPIKRPSGEPGRPRKRPEKLHADKDYDFPRCREALRQRGIEGRIARRGVDTSEKLGRHRWVVERTLAWLARYRRLAVRYERRADIHEAFLHLGCSLICLNQLS